MLLAEKFRGGEGAAQFALLFERLSDRVHQFAASQAGQGNGPLDRWAGAWETLQRLPREVAAVPARLPAARSTSLRGAGVPNSASCAWVAVLRSDGRGAPGAGGVSAKSGGITSGAWRCTANSSGRSRLNSPPPPQPDSMAEAPARIRMAVDLRM